MEAVVLYCVVSTAAIVISNLKESGSGDLAAGKSVGAAQYPECVQIP